MTLTFAMSQLKMSTKTIASLAAGLLVLGTLGVLGYLSLGDLTTRETGLLSTILALLSILATWLVSHLYSEAMHRRAISEARDSHQENLRTFALKAAEKVTNLSDQLNRLIGYLEQELESSEYETEQELVQGREQRIESAIHMIGMLKSMNDTSLSDWQGVIGEELQEQREEKEEREEQLIQLTQRLESMLATRIHSSNERSEGDLGSQIDLLREDIARLIGGITGARPKVRKPKTTRRDVEQECPSCSAQIVYRQRTRPNSVKPVSCKTCGTGLLSRYDKDGKDFMLEVREARTESAHCPSCDGRITGIVDTFPGATANIECTNCRSDIRMIREISGGVKVKIVPDKGLRTVPLSDELMNRVRDALPPQPWPKHIHKSIADELQVSNGTVQRAIRQLVTQGVFLEQVDGELFKRVKVEPNKPSSGGEE